MEKEISRQRRWQLKKREAGCCIRCGKPASDSSRTNNVNGKTVNCEDCARKARPRIRETQRRYTGAVRRNTNSLSYREEKYDQQKDRDQND